jgi:hypothetical protein
MTNHSETTGPAANGNSGGRNSGGRNSDGRDGDAQNGEGRGSDGSAIGDRVGFDAHGAEHQVTLRTPDELADALPYLLGYRPEDSIVLVALHDRGGRGRFGGRARLGIPANKDDWPAVARQLAHGLITGSERRGARPEQMVAYLCQEPGAGETGRQITERLAPLAGLLRTECGRLDVPVIEALCISDSRYWSYCCPSEECCPAEGLPMGLPGTSVLAAAATYAGLQVRGTLRELRARLQPWETAAALEQEVALDTAGMGLVPRMLDQASRVDVAAETLRLARRTMTRFAEAAPVPGALQADLRDDELLGHEDAAALILGLQDRTTRDRAAEWMEAEEAGPALRLWRALARRCVGPYGEHAAAPLTLAGWVAWSAGDEIEAREALAMALGADPDYLFARLLHQACNEGLDPESIRRCLRAEREGRDACARAEGAHSADAETTEDMTRPHTAGPNGSLEAASPGSEGSADAEPLSGPREDAVEECPFRAGSDGSTDAELLSGPREDAVAGSASRAEGVQSPCPSGTGRTLLTTPLTTASRRRKRVRPGARADARPQPAQPEGRQPSAEESRPRPRPVRGPRPGAARRSKGKDDARRPEGTRPGGGAVEEEG